MKKATRAEVDARLRYLENELGNYQRFAYLRANKDTRVVTGLHPDYRGRYVFEIGFSRYGNHLIQVTWIEARKARSAQVFSCQQMEDQARTVRHLVTAAIGDAAQYGAWLQGWQETCHAIAQFENQENESAAALGDSHARA